MEQQKESLESKFKQLSDEYDESQLELNLLESNREGLTNELQKKYLEAVGALSEVDCPNPDYYRGLIAACNIAGNWIKPGGLFKPDSGLPF